MVTPFISLPTSQSLAEWNYPPSEITCVSRSTMRLRRQPSRPMDHLPLNPLSNILRWYRFVSKWRVYPANSNFYREHMGTWSWNSGFLVPGLDRAYRPLKKSTACKLVRRQWGSQRGSNDFAADLGWRRNITRCPMPGLSQGYSQWYHVVADSSKTPSDRKTISSWLSNTRIHKDFTRILLGKARILHGFYMDFIWFYSKYIDFTGILAARNRLASPSGVPSRFGDHLGISQVGVGGFVKRSDRVNARLNIDAGFQFSKMGPVYMYNIYIPSGEPTNSNWKWP